MNKVLVIEMITNLGSRISIERGFWFPCEREMIEDEIKSLNDLFKRRPVEGISRCEYKVKEITHA